MVSVRQSPQPRPLMMMWQVGLVMEMYRDLKAKGLESDAEIDHLALQACAQAALWQEALGYVSRRTHHLGVGRPTSVW
jgi:hypothetical protein